MNKTKIKINNYKTIRDLNINLSNDNLNIILGKNSSGKSNILSAISSIQNKTTEAIPMMREEVEWEVEKKDTSKVSVVSGNEYKRVTIDSDGDIFRTSLLSVKYITEKFKELYENDIDIKSLDPIQEYSYVHESFVRKIDFENWLLSNSESQENTDEDIDDIEEEAVEVEIDDEIDDEDEDEISEEIVNEIFGERKKIHIEYIENIDENQNLLYNYDLYNSYISEEFEGVTDRNLITFINFLINIGYENIVEELKDYLDSNSSLSEEGAGLLERHEAFAERISKKANSKIKNYIISILGNAFEYTLEIKLSKSTLTVNVKNIMNFSIEKQSMKDASSGVKSILTIIMKINELLRYVHDNDNQIILLLDEPEKNIFPYLQKCLVNYLSDIVKKHNITILYTTHQPTMIPSSDFELFIVDRTEIGETIIEKIYGEKDDEQEDDFINYYNDNKDDIDTIIKNITLGNESYANLINIISKQRNS